MTEQAIHSEDVVRQAVEQAFEQSRAAAYEAHRAESHIEGVAAERGRIGLILRSPEGKARPQAARVIAFAADSPSPDTARRLLAAMPPETTRSRIPSLDQRCVGPEIGASHIHNMSRSGQVGDAISASISKLNQAR